jgi:ubiquinone/menaquinone biosynthesis C-methylase UbiE
VARRVVGRAGDVVLETACGTGVLTRQLRAKLPSSVQLVATDVNQAMIDHARVRLHSVGQIAWELADCGALQFPPASFSALACQFGVMFVPDKRAAMREARRVLMEGGLLAFSVWGSLSDNPHARVAQQAIARLLAAEPSPFLQVAYGCDDADAWRSLLRAYDFEVQDLEWIKMPVYCPTAERLALGLVRGTPLRNAVVELGGDLDRVVEAVARALARLGGEAPFQSTMRALVVTAAAR